jgi:hypothetical protein
MKATEVKLGMKVCACRSDGGKKRKHERSEHCIVSETILNHYKKGVSTFWLDFPGYGTKHCGEFEPREIHKIKNWRPGPPEKVIK